MDIKVYKGEQEVINAIQNDGKIHGVVKVALQDLINRSNKQISDVTRVLLVGFEYAYSVNNPTFSIAGVDVDTNSVYLNVTVDAHKLLELRKSQ